MNLINSPHRIVIDCTVIGLRFVDYLREFEANL